MLLIHSIDIPEIYIRAIDKLFPGIIRVAVPRSEDVYASIASHPDIFIFALDYSTIVSSPALYEELAAALSNTGINIIRSQSIPSGNYPQTCPLNAARIGTYVLHNPRYTDPVIRDLVRKSGLELVRVEQGYTRCSVIPVGQNSLITCDEGIARTADGLGLDVQLVSAGNVSLPGEKYGFIGGAAGVTPDGKILFLGDIRQHPDYAEIDRFLSDRGIGYNYLADLPLLDSGSLILLP